MKSERIAHGCHDGGWSVQDVMLISKRARGKVKKKKTNHHPEPLTLNP